MAKKPKLEQLVTAPPALDDMTDEEIAAAAAEGTASAAPTVESDEPDVAVAEPVAPVAPVEPVVAAPVAAKAKPHFVTSFNNTSLAEANRIARAEFEKERALLDEAHRAVLIAINKTFAGRGVPMDVMEAAAVRAIDTVAQRSAR